MLNASKGIKKSLTPSALIITGLGNGAKAAINARISIHVPNVITTTPYIRAILMLIENILPIGSHDPGRETTLPKTLDLVSPIQTGVLSRLLEDYPLGNYLIEGFTHGFRIGYEGDRISPSFSNNSRSALSHPREVEGKILSEIDNNRIAGPFSSPPLPGFKISPIAVRVKENGKIRLLHNLSYPYDSTSINLNIPKSHTTVAYQSLEDAIDILNELYESTASPPFMAKSDIRDAFRLIPIHPSDYHLLGFSWAGAFYYDKALPMGCASACFIFEKFSDALAYILKRKYRASSTVKVLDDFLFISADSMSCNKSYSDFIHLCEILNVPLAPAKSVPPTNRLVFLGIELDTSDMTARLPDEKAVKYLGDIDLLMLSEQAPLCELQAIIGKLMYSTYVISAGRAFLRRLYSLIGGRAYKNAMIPISLSAKKDLVIWKEFLTRLNFKTVILRQPWILSPDIKFSSDASSTGFGGTYGSSWIQGTWPPSWEGLAIAVKEIYPIHVLIELFGHKVKNNRIIIYCDNIAIVTIVNKLGSRCPYIMAILRALVLNLLRHNITLLARFIPGKDNFLADLLSRQIPFHPREEDRSRWSEDQWEAIASLADLPSPLPEHLRPGQFSFET